MLEIIGENDVDMGAKIIVVESSKDKVIDVPVIDGLEFDSIVLYSLLPVSPQSVFETILDLSQNIQKYEIDIDSLLAGADSKKIKPKYWIRNFEE